MGATSYITLERLAVGGMGEVFLARQEGLGGFRRTVVLKRLLPDVEGDDDSMRRFLDEARIAGSLTHDNVVSILEVGDDGSPFIALEYVHGLNAGRLRSLAKKKLVSLPVVVVARILADAARGLAHAHEAHDVDGRPLHIVHRDVAPKNIFIRADGTSKIGDFGIAKADRRLSRTATGQVPGTLSYMAPEQARGQFVDAKADQFSLGIVLWELLTGKALFRADAPQETLRNILQRKIVPPSSLRDDAAPLDKITRRMLERDPRKRFDSLNEAVAAIELAFPKARGDDGKRAVALFVEAIAGEELRERQARIEAGPDETVRVERRSSSAPGQTPSPSPVANDDALHAPIGGDTNRNEVTSSATPSTGSAQGMEATAKMRSGSGSGVVASSASSSTAETGGSDVATSAQRPVRLPSPMTEFAARVRRRRTRFAAAIGVAIVAGVCAVGAGATAAWASLRTPSMHERNVAYLADAARMNPLVFRGWYATEAEAHKLDAAKSAAVGERVAQILEKRLALENDFASHGRTDAQALATQELALTSEAQNALATLGDADFTSTELDEWDYDSCAPISWMPPDAPAVIQKQLKEGLLDFLNGEAGKRKRTTDIMLAKVGADAKAVHAILDPMVGEREALVAQSVSMSEAQLLPTYRKVARIAKDGEDRLIRVCGFECGKAVAQVAFETVEDPDTWQLIHDTPPSQRHQGQKER
jgi:serine/threonine-protein kinase